jgi:thioredoxin 1
MRVGGVWFCSRSKFPTVGLDAAAKCHHGPRMAQQFNESNFDAEVLKSDVPVLVDFWAEWCGPCKMIGPLIDELGAELEGKAKVGKVNVDEARDLAVRFGVRSIPLLLFFKDGEVADQVVGAGMSKEMLKQKLLALV